MSWLITGGNTYIPMDSSAASYITAVETADGQVLEPAVRCAIDQFVLGCKTDGIWNAIKASCILTGARTLSGALVPLVGTAPTNVGPFVSGDYNRKTGLTSNSTAKYLDSNRAGSAGTQNNIHLSIYYNQRFNDIYRYIGGNQGIIELLGFSVGFGARVNSSSIVFSGTSTGTGPGFLGASRSLNSEFAWRDNKLSGIASNSSTGQSRGNFFVFRSNSNVNAVQTGLAFYSIGESLDLALLDARVTALVNAFAAAIP